MLQLPISKNKLQLSISKPISRSRSRIYRSINVLNQKQKTWKHFLKNQLNLKPIIVQFQNIDINAVSYSKKQAIRQSFLVKKEIIKCINENNIEQLMQKVQVLQKMASCQSQQFKLNSLIALLKIREQITNSLGQFKYATLQYIEKAFPPNFYKTEQTSIIFIKAYCVLCMFLLKVKGILMKQSQRSIVQKALDLKKREFIYCESQSKKLEILKALIFLTFQFYNIIFLLKSDQNLILYYYNRICSYIDLYKIQFKNYEQLESEFQIEERLNKMKPLYLSIQIYDDSKKRRQLSLKNTENQMLNKHYQLPESLIIRKKQNSSLKPLNDRITNSHAKAKAEQSNFKRNSSSLFRRSITGSLQKQIIKVINSPRTSNKYYNKHQEPQKYEKKLSINKSQKVFNELSYMLFSQEQFSFQFIFMHSYQLYKGQFRCNLVNNAHNSFNLRITLKGPKFYDSIINSENIENSLTKVQMGIFCKMLWKLVKIMLNELQFKFMFISNDDDYAEQSLPFHLNREYELQTLTQIHELILYFYRKKYLQRTMVGKSFPFVPINNKELLQIYKKENNQKGIFTKRKGFIYKNLGRESQPNYHFITFCYYEKDSFKIIQFRYNNGAFKQAIICAMGKNFQCKKIEKRIKDEKFFKKLLKMRFKKETASIIAELACNTIDRFLLQKNQQYWVKNNNIEEEFEILKNPVLNKAQGPIIHQYFQPKIKRVQRVQTPLQKITIKLSSIYKVFTTIVYEYYIRFINQKLQLIQPKYCRNITYRYQRLRMYKIAFSIKNGDREKYCISKMNMKGKPFLKTQKIYLKLKKHKIIKQKRKFYMIIEFQSLKNENIYEIVALDANQKYIYKEKQKFTIQMTSVTLQKI